MISSRISFFLCYWHQIKFTLMRGYEIAPLKLRHYLIHWHGIDYLWRSAHFITNGTIEGKLFLDELKFSVLCISTPDSKTASTFWDLSSLYWSWIVSFNKGSSHVFIKQNKRLSFLLLRRCSTLSILYCGIEYFEIYNKTSEFFDLSDNICADDISKDSLERIIPFLLNTCTLNQTTLIAKIFL